MKFLFSVLLLFTLSAGAQVTSTRVSDYDWQCQDSTSTKISDHARFDTAFTACLNDPKGVYVQGGKYRIGKGTKGTATLSWTVPTKNTDNSPLTDLKGYRIEYGSPLPVQSLDVALITSYVFTNLAPGTWCFTVRAIANRESVPSNQTCKVIS